MIGRIGVAICAAAVLVGCASVGTRAPTGGDTITGRLSVRVAAQQDVPAQSLGASFELAGSAEAGRLNLSSPLGTVMAQARWAGGRAWLITPQGERAYPDLGHLAHDVLGEQLPVAALFDWLRGRPWRQAPSTPLPTNSGFSQLGWSVDLSRFSEGWVTADRPQAPAVQVRARVDAPESP